MLEEMTDQRKQLERFVQSQLLEGTDFGAIPGITGKSLFKPGAEKLASIYQLGSRIVKIDREVNIKENFAMFEVTVEVFHVPSGKAISQCSAVTNSQELKYREKKDWTGVPKGGVPKKIPQLIGDILNTLSKMAQKRAFVGAVIMATKASDFLTHDLAEDEEDYNDANPGWKQKQEDDQEKLRAKTQQANAERAAPQSRATEGSFEDFKGGGFASPKQPEAIDERKAISMQINAERVRLQWSVPDLKKYAFDNFGKETTALTEPEMAMLVGALRRAEKRA